MFTPTLSLLVQWHQKFRILSGRIYGKPERHLDLINFVDKNIIDDRTPDPNDDFNITSNYHWLKYSDTYTFPYLEYFESWEHLFTLLNAANFSNISMNMHRHNTEQKIQSEPQPKR